ncbi:MAG: rod shape-determining protein [Lachnospiraceae bacterium]|nr:rod shape-determining protein [Lachnospiraceae bacterium]
MSNAFGIDLGTNNIKIYSLANDDIMVQKNLIAIQNKNTIFAYGDSAYDMYEKAPANFDITFPVNNGVISDLNNMETLIKFFISDLQDGQLKPADFIVAVPTDITDVEKRAFYDLIKEANVKGKKILVADKAVADGLGMGLDVKSTQGIMVVDVGYETTEISVISLGGIVLNRLLNVGGLAFDENIKSLVRNDFHLHIGNKSAEFIKCSLTEHEAEGKPVTVYGRDVVTGLPVERDIPTALVDKSLMTEFEKIVDAIKVYLDLTPPELAADIYKNGIYLTGGASQVNHLVEAIGNGTKLKVNATSNPMTTVAEGLGRMLKESYYQSIAYSVEGMSK